MYSSVLVLMLIGQSPLRGQEKGTVGAAIAEEQGRINANLGRPSANAKPVGDKNVIRLNTIPTIEGMSSDTLKSGADGPLIFM